MSVVYELRLLLYKKKRIYPKEILHRIYVHKNISICAYLLNYLWAVFEPCMSNFIYLFRVIGLTFLVRVFGRHIFFISWWSCKWVPGLVGMTPDEYKTTPGAGSHLFSTDQPVCVFFFSVKLVVNFKYANITFN